MGLLLQKRIGVAGDATYYVSGVAIYGALLARKRQRKGATEGGRERERERERARQRERERERGFLN